MPSETLPSPADLAAAVREVIRQNVALGYNPVRFRQATGGGDNPELLAVCTALINSPDTLGELERALNRHPRLLTLEDLVATFGAEWGLKEGTIEQATGRSVWFDDLVGFNRFERDLARG